MQTGKGNETNREFAETNERFRKACGPQVVCSCGTANKFDAVYCTECKQDLQPQKSYGPTWAVTPPTPRQASKYRNKKGAAYKGIYRS